MPGGIRLVGIGGQSVDLSKGGLLSLAGVALTIITVPLAVVPGLAIIPQFTFSMTMYGGFVAASAFSDTIYADMSRIHWNPFNSNTSLVGKYGKVSFYRGVPVFRHNISDFSVSVFGMIFLHRKDGSENILRHEWGHIAQAILMGQRQYLIRIAIPSLITNIYRMIAKPYRICITRFLGKEVRIFWEVQIEGIIRKVRWLFPYGVYFWEFFMRLLDEENVIFDCHHVFGMVLFQPLFLG